MATIKSSSEIDRVFRTGRRVSHPLVIALVADTPPGRDLEGRVAFIAGKRLGNAVARNRAKRVLRESARASGAPWGGADILLLARERTSQAGTEMVTEGINQVVRRAGLSS